MTDLFKGCVLKTAKFKLPNGNELTLRELTARERGQLRNIAESDIAEGQARIVCLGCDQLTEDDLDQVQNLPGALVVDMADKVLELSGLGEEAKDEAKNV